MSTGITETVNIWLKNTQYFLLPGTCVLCRRPTGRDHDLCRSCESALPRITRPCPRCALPLPPGVRPGMSCGTCLVSPPPFTRLVAPINYSPAVAALITGFKYHGHLGKGRVLTDLLGSHIRQVYGENDLPDLLLPVPLHPRRIRQRGFNQALEISRLLARALSLPLQPEMARRTRPTEQQAGLSARARRSNLRGAFKIDGDLFAAPGPLIALVDDVVTTGTTVTALATALRKAGAREVHVWALARTLL